jgi:preprotein translocase subunit YajC
VEFFTRAFIFLGNTLSPVLGETVNDVIQNVTDTVTQTAPGTASTAAETEAAAGGLLSNPLMMIVLYGAIIVGAYFLLMRPQRKREKKAKEMQAAIRTGDNIVTSGGLFGRVADVGEDCFIIEFGTNRGVRIPVLKSDVVAIRSPKTTPAPKEAIEGKDEK